MALTPFIFSFAASSSSEEVESLSHFIRLPSVVVWQELWPRESAVTKLVAHLFLFGLLRWR